MQRRQKLRIQYYYSLVYADAAIEHLRVYTLEFTFWVGSYMSVSSKTRCVFLTFYICGHVPSVLFSGQDLLILRQDQNSEIKFCKNMFSIFFIRVPRIHGEII